MAESQRPHDRATTTVVFRKDGAVPPVFIAGSFSNPPWELLEMECETDNDGQRKFFRKIEVEEDIQFQYKFRIGTGDWWTISDDSPTATDDSGNVNNIGEVHRQSETPVHSGDAGPVTETGERNRDHTAEEAVVQEKDHDNSHSQVEETKQTAQDVGRDQQQQGPDENSHEEPAQISGDQSFKEHESPPDNHIPVENQKPASSAENSQVETQNETSKASENASLTPDVVSEHTEAQKALEQTEESSTTVADSEHKEVEGSNQESEIESDSTECEANLVSTEQKKPLNGSVDHHDDKTNELDKIYDIPPTHESDRDMKEQSAETGTIEQDKPHPQDLASLSGEASKESANEEAEQVAQQNLKEDTEQEPEQQAEKTSDEQLDRGHQQNSEKLKEGLRDQSEEKLEGQPVEVPLEELQKDSQQESEGKLEDQPKETLLEEPKRELHEQHEENPKEDTPHKSELTLEDQPKETLLEDPKQELNDQPEEEPKEEMQLQSDEKLEDQPKEELFKEIKEETEHESEAKPELKEELLEAPEQQPEGKLENEHKEETEQKSDAKPEFKEELLEVSEQQSEEKLEEQPEKNMLGEYREEVADKSEPKDEPNVEVKDESQEELPEEPKEEIQQQPDDKLENKLEDQPREELLEDPKEENLETERDASPSSNVIAGVDKHNGIDNSTEGGSNHINKPEETQQIQTNNTAGTDHQPTIHNEPDAKAQSVEGDERPPKQTYDTTESENNTEKIMSGDSCVSPNVAAEDRDLTVEAMAKSDEPSAQDESLTKDESLPETKEFDGPTKGEEAPFKQKTLSAQDVDRSETDTPGFANTAAEVADSAIILDQQPATPDLPDKEAGMTGMRRLSSTPISQVAATAALVADTAEKLDDTDSTSAQNLSPDSAEQQDVVSSLEKGEDVKSSALNDHSNGEAQTHTGSISDDKESNPTWRPIQDSDLPNHSHSEPVSLFPHECLGLQKDPNPHSEERSLSSQLPDETDEYDLSDPTLERFPSDKDEIMTKMRKMRSGMEEDETLSEKGLPALSPTLGQGDDTPRDREPLSPTSKPDYPRLPRRLGVPRKTSSVSNRSSVVSLTSIAEGEELEAHHGEIPEVITRRGPDQIATPVVTKQLDSDEDEAVVMVSSKQKPDSQGPERQKDCPEPSAGKQHDEPASPKELEVGNADKPKETKKDCEGLELNASDEHAPKTVIEANPDAESPEVVLHDSQSTGNTATEIAEESPHATSEQQSLQNTDKTPQKEKDDHDAQLKPVEGTSSPDADADAGRTVADRSTTPNSVQSARDAAKHGNWLHAFWKMVFVDLIGNFLRKLCGWDKRS